MNKLTTYLLLIFGIAIFAILSYPLYRIYKEVDATTPPSYHEYTVLDLETGKELIVYGDDNKEKYHANDTAWRNDRFLYPNIEDAPDNAMQVVIIASYNQLYE